MLDETNLHLENYQYSIKSVEPFVIIIHNFLSNDEIDLLLNATNHRFQRSYVVGSDNAISYHEKRTSSTCMLSRGETDVVKTLEDRVAKITRLDKTYQEPFQLVKYEKEQEYASHYDYFDPTESYGREEIASRGQRCMTILAYMVEPDSGGSTYFPRLGLDIPPTRGSAVLWFNTNKFGSVDERTEHGGMSVKSGTKIAMNVWIRDKRQ
jgi:prolyl 4-hydroxylase